MTSEKKSELATKRSRRMLNVLIVEDDAVLGKSVRQGLVEQGNDCHWSRNGSQAVELISTGQFDAVILDIMLPDVDGLKLLTTIRQAGIAVPVILLTALGSVADRVAGLNAGADDYLVKPFAFPEVLARLQAITRRDRSRPSATVTAGPLQLDLTTRRATRNGKEVDLTPTEFSILEFLMRFGGQVVTRKMLCEHLWEADWEGTTNVIDVHINRLRGKIDRGFETPLIHTIRGRGYALRPTADDF
jgi:two-component system OmpR family response regulator/two-component system copper resistance phosphate regulon response regulator CusR